MKKMWTKEDIQKLAGNGGGGEGGSIDINEIVDDRTIKVVNDVIKVNETMNFTYNKNANEPGRIDLWIGTQAEYGSESLMPNQLYFIIEEDE